MKRRILCVHNGALGDFLNCWPALAGVARQHGTGSVGWAGKSAYRRWVAPLGLVDATSEERKAVDRLYGADRWPEALAHCTVIWFGLERPPCPLDCAPEEGQLLFVRGVAQEGYAPPRERALDVLEAAGVPRVVEWPSVWADLFGRWGGADSCTIQLFPGAGHLAKQWPLVKFFELADRLESAGWQPRFTLGPAELDRGMRIDDRPVDTPEDFQELERLLQGARAVCGNDCGPMHLAGMFGAPGVVLFGPTSAKQWGPPGLAPVRAPLDCRPCTRTTANIPCTAPACMRSIPVNEVERALDEVLRGSREET